MKDSLGFALMWINDAGKKIPMPKLVQLMRAAYQISLLPRADSYCITRMSVVPKARMSAPILARGCVIRLPTVLSRAPVIMDPTGALTVG